MADLAVAFPNAPVRKPPAAGQYNWITGAVDVVPEQMVLPLPPVDDAVLPDDGSVILLATENGSQLFVSGFGLFIGKKSERVVVKQGKVGLRAGSAHATARDHHCFARDQLFVGSH